MNAQQITQKVVKAIEDQDWDGAQTLLAKDYTFSGAVPQPIPGLPKVPATGRKITVPRERVRVKAQGDKPINWEVEPVADGGVLGILKQMGVVLPNHA